MSTSDSEDDIIDTNSSDDDSRRDLESPIGRRKPLNTSGPIFPRQQKSQLSSSIFIYGFLAFIIFTLIASYIIKPDPEPGASSHDCTLSDGTVVKANWSGKGHGHNFCNDCGCNNGRLDCTKKTCEKEKPKIPETTQPRVPIESDEHLAKPKPDSPKTLTHNTKSKPGCPDIRKMKFDFHQDYHPTDEILDFFKKEQKCADVFVNMEVLGKTTEGREMVAIQVGKEGSHAIWINCGFHAREWISPSTCLYIYDYLLNGPEEKRKSVLEDVIFYFTPLANPDGYEYSRTGDRDWRKTREIIPGSSCKGIDLDRNWPYKFELGVDISKKPCEENYGGLKALAAPENRFIHDYIKDKPNIGVFLDVHSYGLEMGAPYGWTKDEPEHWDAIKKAGEHAGDAIYSVHKKRYKVGQAGKLIYKTSGIASDWAYAELGAICSFTIEVRGSLRERWEFKLPKTEIIPNGEEVMEGVITFTKDMKSNLCSNFKA